MNWLVETRSKSARIEIHQLADGGFARQRGARDGVLHRLKRARHRVVDLLSGVGHRPADEIAERLGGSGEAGADIGADVGWVGHGSIRVMLQQIFKLASGERRARPHGSPGQHRAPFGERQRPEIARHQTHRA